MKENIQVELVKLDLPTIINLLEYQAIQQLKDVDIKQLEGREPMDFVQTMFLKVLDGTRNWDTAATDDIKKFLSMTLRSEISNYLKYAKRRGNIETYEDEIKDEDGRLTDYDDENN